MSEMHKAVDKSRDAKYFTINPRIVKYYSRSPYDYALWDTVKEVAGDSSECYLSTEDLAALSGMSAGKVSECRKYWIELGFLDGEIRRDAGYPQPVWHLTIPDLWSKNIKWAENHLSIKSRIEFKKSLHEMKSSRDEEGVPTCEGGGSPHETKKKEKEEKKGNNNNENSKPYDRAKGIEEAKKRKAKADALRESTDILVEWGKLSSDKEQRYNEMEDRIYKSTGLTVSDRWYRERVMDFLLEKDEHGETIETFAKACKDDPYNMPKFFQIAQKLSLLKDTWGLAFVDDDSDAESEPSDRLETL
jgi:hypothetical protein